MSATFVQDGKAIEITAGTAINQGDVVVLGGIVGVANRPIVSGGTGVIEIEGVWSMPKESALVISGGETMFWNPTSGYATTSSGGSNVVCGKAVAPSGATVTIVNVKLN